MIDLHTHLLPMWDDGARDWDETSKMCEVARRDGIEKIVLTPHIFRLNRHDDDLGVLEAALAEFDKRTAGCPIAFYRGAEIFIHHEMEEKLGGDRLTINRSHYLFIEFPSEYVLPGTEELLYSLMIGGFLPIISHPERNRVFGARPELLYEFVRRGSLAQVTAKSLTGGFGSGIKATADLFLGHNLVHFIASDAHDPESRPPILSKAVEEAKKIVGLGHAVNMVTINPEAILDDKAIPDPGEPENPAKQRKKWAIRLPKRTPKKSLDKT